VGVWDRARGLRPEARARLLLCFTGYRRRALHRRRPLLRLRRQIPHQRATPGRLRHAEPAALIMARIAADAVLGAALVHHHALARVVELEQGALQHALLLLLRLGRIGLLDVRLRAPVALVAD